MATNLPCLRSEALRELTDSLIDVLQHESNVIATKAWSKGLIGEELYHNSSITPREKVARVITAVSARMKVDQTAFDKFIEILKSDASLTYLADKLTERSKPPQVTSKVPELRDLMKELKVIASNWHNFGVMLEVNSRQLASVAADYPRSCEDCLREMLKIWLKNVDPPPSWSAVVDALENIDERRLAKEIRDRWCT